MFSKPIEESSKTFCLGLLYTETIEQGLNDLFAPIPQDIYAKIEKLIPLKKLTTIYFNNPDNVFQKLKQYQKLITKMI